MRTYVINLARSADRRQHMTAQLQSSRLDYEIVTAIDGRELDVNNPNLVDPALLAKWPHPGGGAGCALSHIRAYERVLEDGGEVALILEDDIALPSDLADLADAVAPHLTGAEVAMLNYGGWPPDPLKISREGSVDLPSSRMLALPIDIAQLVNAGAYLITREACERWVASVPPLRAASDEWLAHYRQARVDRVRCVLPQPVVKSPQFDSTIGIYSLGGGLKARLLAPLVRSNIPVLRQAIVRRRRRIMSEFDRSEIVDTPFIEKPSRLG